MSKKKRKQKIKKNGSGSRLTDIQKMFDKAYNLHDQGKLGEAEKLYSLIIRQDPRHSDSLHLMGVIALERHDYDKAITMIERAIVSYRNAAPYYNNIGLAYWKKGRVQEATDSFRKALEINPEYAEANNNLGTLLKDKIDLTGAASCFERASRNKSGFAAAYYNLGTVLCDQARIKASLVAYQKALQIKPDFIDAQSNFLYTLHFSDAHSPKDIFIEHKKWAESLSLPDLIEQESVTMEDIQNRPLNVGYVSPDFCTHSVAFFIEEVLSKHNRKNVTVFSYSNTPKIDDFTQRFKELSDHWRDIRDLADDKAAELIRKDKIDILVDLAGHTRNNRILIFALKPAPIQVTWLGYPDTTGLSTMDYRLTDSIADPVGESDQLHSEKLYRMPHGFLCYRPAGEFFPVSTLPMLSAGGVTFGSFNNNSKISPSLIQAWATILKKVPGSRLKLKALSLSDFGTRKYILEAFQNYGIPSDRIWFEGYRMSLKEHFLLYNTVDIALDTFPYNGTTTTCEALWMGVPVIVLSGNSHVSRVGNSILTHLELEELIAKSIDDYVNKAVQLANDPERLNKVRTELRSRMIDSPLMDPIGFTSDLEDAFRAMWKTWAEKSRDKIIVSTKEGDINTQGLFQINLNALCQIHPHVVPLLDEPAPFDIKIQNSSRGIPNVLITKESGESFLLYSEKELSEDIGGLINEIRDIKGRTLCVMGAGLFIHSEHILDVVGKTNLVVFFEAVPAMLKTAMENIDLRKIINHPNVKFAVGKTADPYLLFKEEQDKLFVSEIGKFVEHTPTVSLMPEWYHEKRRTFDHYFKSLKISLNTVISSGKHFFENSFKNLLVLSKSRPLDELHDRYKNKPAIVVASGPSLSKNIHLLKLIKNNAWIIAADSALAPLMSHGIKPHAIVSVDYNDFTFEKLAPFVDELFDVDLIYLPNVTPKIVNGIQYRSSYYTFPDNYIQGLFNHLLDRNGRAIEDIQSVIHLAITTAQIAGCNPIVFIGLDLAFSQTHDHAAGTLLHWGNNRDENSNTTLVEGVNGHPVPSSNGFISMAEICRRMIKDVPERHYIDATEGGAKISGTEIMPLEEAISKYCGNQIDFNEENKSMEGADQINILMASLRNVKNEIEEALNQIKRYAREHERVYEFIEKHPEKVEHLNFPNDVNKSIKILNQINRVLEDSETVFFIKGLMVEAHEQFKTMEIDIIECGPSNKDRFSATLKQQGLVQKIRGEALNFLKDLIGCQLNLLQSIDGCSDKEEDIFRLCDMLVDHGYFKTAESYLNKIDDNASYKNYLSGCMDIHLGKIESGKESFQRASDGEPTLSPNISSFVERKIKAWLKSGKLASHNKISLDYASRLVVSAKTERWANLALQEFMWIKCEPYLDKIISFQISHSDMAAFNAFIDAWKEYSDIIPEWYFFKSFGHVYTKHYDLAQDALNASIKIEAATIPLKPMSVSINFFRAMIALMNGDEQCVMKTLNDELTAHDDPDTMVLISVLHMQKNNEDMTDKIFLGLTERHDSPPWIGTACELYKKGEFINLCRQCDDLNVLSSFYYIKGKCLLDAGMDDDAKKCFRTAINLDPQILNSKEKQWVVSLVEDLWEGDVGRIEICINKKKYDNAIKIAEEWYSTRFALESYHMVMAVIIESNESTENAILYLESHYDEICVKPQSLVHLSRLLFICGRREEAQDRLMAAVKINSDAAFLWEDMGDAWFNENDHPKALQAYEQCITSLPDKIDVLRKIGDVYSAMGQNEAAVMAYNAVVEKKSP